ncbi:MAG: FMN-binding protein, partial [Alistipes sp.]|nr:FMN-binding protein [Alistipes sp.]
MKSSLKNMVLMLFAISTVSALLVAVVYNSTKDTINQTEQKKKDIAKLEVLPAFEGTPSFSNVTRTIGDFEINITTVSVDDMVIGYAVEAPSITANGYADRISLMVGFVEDDMGNATINGVKVLSQKETPGLGANMTIPGNKLEKSILGKNPAELVFKVSKDDKSGSFDALT